MNFSPITISTIFPDTIIIFEQFLSTILKYVLYPSKI